MNTLDMILEIRVRIGYELHEGSPAPQTVAVLYEKMNRLYPELLSTLAATFVLEENEDEILEEIIENEEERRHP